MTCPACEHDACDCEKNAAFGLRLLSHLRLARIFLTELEQWESDETGPSPMGDAGRARLAALLDTIGRLP